MPVPDGWFAVAYGDELSAGEVKPMRWFGRHLVVFRDADGQARVLDAHCRHMGAHLGHGGTVCGRSVRCPFHAWEWDGETGECVAIPYAKKIPAKARMRSWETRERNGLVLVWHHGGGAAPSWEVPEVEEATNPAWTDPDRYDWTIQTQVQEIAENGVDTAHFRFVHGTVTVPESEVEFDGDFRHAVNHIRMNTPRGEVDGTIEARSFGIGLSIVRYSGIFETVQVLSTTPIDERTVVHRKSFRQPRPTEGEKPSRAPGAFIRNVVKQLGEDVPIWENKVYQERPLLCDGDGPIGKYRQWCRRFYSDPAAPAAE